MKARGIEKRLNESEIGKLFLIGLQLSPEITKHDRELLRRVRPAGVILFQENFLHDSPYDIWLDALDNLLREVRTCIGRDQIIVAIDHEGGQVTRPPAPITRFSFPREWAHIAGRVGQCMAIELRSIGVNLSFAPLLDIDSNPANPVIGKRAFGTDAETVIAAADPFITELQKGGVIACPKHFPGHGDTSEDSHYTLPVVHADLSRVYDLELAPYRALVKKDIHIIMSAHVLFSKLDSLPATLSRRILQCILRDELGFDGVIVTDDLGMKAVRPLLERSDTVMKALQAGSDLLMICARWTDTGVAVELARRVTRALKEKQLDLEVVERAMRRVERLLSDLPQHMPTKLDRAVLERHERIATM